MKRIVSALLALLMGATLLTGCGGRTPSQSQPPPETPDKLAICIGAINHPLHRIAQYSFTAGARAIDLADPLISGFSEGSQQDLLARWAGDIESHGINGVLLWTGDDQCYEFMREWHAKGVKFVVPHFLHDFYETRTFLDANIASVQTQYGIDAADFIVNQLAAKGITSGTIGMTQAGACVTTNAANDGFRKRIAELNTGFVLANTIFEGGDPSEAINKVAGVIKAYPDIVAAFGMTGISAQSWSAAKTELGREDIVVVALDYTLVNLDILGNGGVDALIATPVYDECYQSAALLQRLIDGETFDTEDTWYTILDAPLITADGTGVSGIEHYAEIIAQVSAFFENQ